MLMAMQRNTYGTWMRRECFGRLYLIMVWAKGEAMLRRQEEQEMGNCGFLCLCGRLEAETYS